MKRLLCGMAFAILTCAGLGSARAGDERESEPNTIHNWNELARDAVRAAKASDADAARAYAMVNVAMFDAANGILSRGPFGRAPALVPPDRAPQA